MAAFACADEPEAAADLIVSSVTVSDATPVAGQTITLRATVRNRGDGSASPTTLRFYRSNDSTISTSDTELGSDTVPALDVSAAESLSFVTIVRIAGAFYLGVCIDFVSAESDTANNCSDGVLVTVEEREPAPDLIVSISVSDASPVTGQEFEFTATVENSGDGPSSSRTRLRFYESDDSTIDTSDVELDSAFVPALAASAEESGTFDHTFHAPATLHFGVCIDPVSAESDTLNNCSRGVLVTVE